MGPEIVIIFLWSQKQSLSSVWGKGIEKSYIILNQIANDKYGDWY